MIFHLSWSNTRHLRQFKDDNMFYLNSMSLTQLLFVLHSQCDEVSRLLIFNWLLVRKCKITHKRKSPLDQRLPVWGNEHFLFSFSPGSLTESSFSAEKCFMFSSGKWLKSKARSQNGSESFMVELTAANFALILLWMKADPRPSCYFHFLCMGALTLTGNVFSFTAIRSKVLLSQ